MAFALTGARVFDGTNLLDDAAVVVEGPRITFVGPAADLPAGLERRSLEGGYLAPGFIDVQVNGGGGVLLNDRPSRIVVRRIAESHRKFGTTGMLPTVITDAPEVMQGAITAVREARKAGGLGILGIHIEGPFIDPARKGAHDAQFIRVMSEADVQALGQLGCGQVMLTLAPNKVDVKLIRTLSAQGVHVSLGHSDASFEDTRKALKAGASAFTHLFNAMSPLQAREPGMVGAALTDTRSFLGIIADGLHVHNDTLKFAFAATALDRFMLVTDAMPTAAEGPGHFLLQGRTVKRTGQRLQLDDGTLAGSNLTMDAALRHCVQRLGVPLTKALRMAATNPARFLGLDHELGVIVPGALASLVHLSETLRVQQTWLEGVGAEGT